MKIQSVNPFTEEVTQEFDAMSPEDCFAAVSRARDAFRDWRRLDVCEREPYIKAAGEVLRRNQRRYAELVTEEMGKPILQSMGEIEKCAWLCDFYAESSHGFLEDEVVRTEAERSFVTFEPLGVVLGIMPWNFPFWQVFRFAIPVMAAGNVVLMKHASNVPRTAVEIEKLLHEAGFPRGVFQTLLTGAGTVMRLIEEDAVEGVSLTGSVSAGSKVGEAAGRGIKRLVLELGGSDPFLVLDDADLDLAADMAIRARFMNGGQSCIAAKRLIVAAPVVEKFKERFISRFRSIKVGDPMREDTFIGPMSKREFVTGLEEQLNDAKEKGAEILYGPEPPRGKGFFFQPAVVMGVKPGMKVLEEEVFGPIVPVIVAKDEDEMVRIANETEFGLGASVWTGNPERGIKLSRRIEAGFVAINDMVKSDPRLPFGGVKKSGVGRELSHFGLKEFTNAKTVVVRS